MSKVDLTQPGDCWLWAAGLQKGRVAGMFGLKSNGKRRWMYAHTASWRIFVGEPPRGKVERLAVKCANKTCVNPEHLFVETIKGTGVTRNSPLTYEEKIEAKFWAHVAPSDDLECLLYSPTRPCGYAMIYLMNKDGRRTGIPAPRYAMQLRYGPIPRDVVVLQRCGNKACVSINHLYMAQPGYYQAGKTRLHEPSGPRGEKRAWAKLKETDIKRIFHWHRERGYSTGEIARYFGVSPITIRHVLRRETWRHVPI